jgi:integrase/recombinase XerD
LLNTGMKKSECMGIHLSHIDLSHEAEPTVQVRYREARQKHKDRSLWLGAGVVPILRAYREKYKPAEYLFECTARNLEYVLRDLAKAAGIEGGVSFESLRWTAALRDYQAGMQTDALRQKLGLSKLRWREALEKLEQLAQPPL